MKQKVIISVTAIVAVVAIPICMASASPRVELTQYPIAVKEIVVNDPVLKLVDSTLCQPLREQESQSRMFSRRSIRSNKIYITTEAIAETRSPFRYFKIESVQGGITPEEKVKRTVILKVRYHKKLKTLELQSKELWLPKEKHPFFSLFTKKG